MLMVKKFIIVIECTILQGSALAVVGTSQTKKSTCENNSKKGAKMPFSKMMVRNLEDN